MDLLKIPTQNSDPNVLTTVLSRYPCLVKNRLSYRRCPRQAIPLPLTRKSEYSPLCLCFMISDELSKRVGARITRAPTEHIPIQRTFLCITNVTLWGIFWYSSTWNHYSFHAYEPFLMTGSGHKEHEADLICGFC